MRLWQNLRHKRHGQYGIRKVTYIMVEDILVVDAERRRDAGPILHILASMF